MGISLEPEQYELLKKTKELIEELLETMDIMADKDTIEAIREDENDIKEGKVRDYNEFMKEINN